MQNSTELLTSNLYKHTLDPQTWHLKVKGQGLIHFVSVFRGHIRELLALVAVK